MFGPDRAHLFIACELAAASRGFRGSDGRTFVGRKRQGRRFIRSGKPENDAGDVILSGNRQIACRFQSVVEKFRHR